MIIAFDRQVADLRRLEGCEGCALPNDCTACERFVCNRCERAVGWECGACDDAPTLCDECWLVLGAELDEHVIEQDEAAP
jgi:hypothetical protein